MELQSGPEPITIGDDQRVQSLWKLHREAVDIKFFVDVADIREHAMFQLPGMTFAQMSTHTTLSRYHTAV